MITSSSSERDEGVLNVVSFGDTWPGGFSDERLGRVRKALLDREQYRADKNWFMADILRKDLESQGWHLEDSKEKFHPHPYVERSWQGRFFSATVQTMYTRALAQGEFVLDRKG